MQSDLTDFKGYTYGIKTMKHASISYCIRYLSKMVLLLSISSVLDLRF